MASAKPPRVITLIVEPPRYIAKPAARIDSGIERKIATVDWKLPRKSRITSEARIAASAASCSRLCNGVADVARLVEDRVELHAIRQAEDLRQQGLHAIDHRDGVGAALLQHGDVHRALAVDAHDVLLDLRGVFGVADVADQHRRSPAPVFTGTCLISAGPSIMLLVAMK